MAYFNRYAMTWSASVRAGSIAIARYISLENGMQVITLLHWLKVVPILCMQALPLAWQTQPSRLTLNRTLLIAYVVVRYSRCCTRRIRYGNVQCLPAVVSVTADHVCSDNVMQALVHLNHLSCY